MSITKEQFIQAVDFWSIVEQIEAKNIPCSVSLTTENEVMVECGFGYPDELVDDLLPILKESGRRYHLCASASGYEYTQTYYINFGGRNKQWPVTPELFQRYED